MTESNHARHQKRIIERFRTKQATRKDWKREKRNDIKNKEK